MVRRVTPAQFQNILRQARQKQQRAINDYNRAVRDYNAGARRRVADYNRAVDTYNREARAHNARVAENRRRLRSALQSASIRPAVVRRTTYYRSVQTLHVSYESLEAAAPGTWLEGRDDILDMAQKDTENSLALANATDSPPAGPSPQSPDPEVERRLSDFSPDLAARWRGALFSLSPENPDAARHFSASCREMLARMIEIEAPDDAILAWNPQAPLHDGRPTRRARLAYSLVQSGRASDAVAAFADADVEEVIELFAVFNDGTHGSSGVFDTRHLGLIKQRVEGAVSFLHSVLKP